MRHFYQPVDRFAINCGAMGAFRGRVNMVSVVLYPIGKQTTHCMNKRFTCLYDTVQISNLLYYLLPWLP